MVLSSFAESSPQPSSNMCHPSQPKMEVILRDQHVVCSHFEYATTHSDGVLNHKSKTLNMWRTHEPPSNLFPIVDIEIRVKMFSENKIAVITYISVD